MSSLALLATGLLLQGRPVVRRFPVGYLDYHGFVPVEGAKTTARTRRGMAQLEGGAARQAYATLTKAWEDDPADYVALHGMVLAAAAQGALGDLVGSLNGRWTGGHHPSVAPRFAFALVYATAVARELWHEGDARVRIPGTGGTPSNYTASLPLVASARRPGDRAYAVMVASASFANDDYAPARRALLDWLAAHPKDVEVHLMLGRMYLSGTFSHQSGNGPRKIAPPEEQLDMGKAYAQYRQALAIDPKCAEAYYELGYALPSTDPQRTASLKRAVALGLHDPGRQRAAERTLRERGG